MAEATFKVEGMTCGGCASSVKKALERVGVTAEVDHEKGIAKVAGDADENVVRKAVEAAGFDFAGRA
ncbi:MAG: heavy-metal-associated domain-containing protein [Alphaproteobacteria bacterium]|nr:heavy-metal-associated domain-containing protein [Alphaproteobacteria bacterium]